MKAVTDTPLLTVERLTKRFGGLVAVKDISFEIRGGEILGLIGPNGSGKSTVMKCIMGIEKPNAGSVKLGDLEISGWPSHQIARQGVGIVFQHARPLHRQTILEHIILALLPDNVFSLKVSRQMYARAEEIAARVGLARVKHRLPRTLPFADLRRLELAKAIARNPRVVLVDEPFAGLTTAEVEDFSELIGTFRSDGHAVLLVDHNVKGVAALVDRVVAMYVGEKIAEGSAVDVMRNEKVRTVYLGGKIDTVARPPRESESGAALLNVEGVNVLYGKAQALQNVSLRVGQGEFVSVVGLNGAGKTTLFNAISGLLPYSGAIQWNGAELRGNSAAVIARRGIVQCPENRELFGDMSVRENLDLGAHHASRQDSAKQIRWLFDLFPILEARQSQYARTLSGGEQQMLAIARALMMRPKLLILDEPTLGLAPVILESLSKALEKLRASTDITVLLGEQNVTFALPHADRVYVLEHGTMVWEGPPTRFAQEASAGLL